MGSLDSLPPDQRAVLELVLMRGRTYDQIAQMLSIDRAGVRERALAAFDALGPQTRVPPERRALITDYVLAQLPPKVSEDTRQRLAQSAGERAWARVIASELAPLSSRSLPEIPTEAAVEPEPVAAESGSASELSSHPFEPVAEPAAATQSGSTSTAAGARNARPSSRRGGIILLAIGAIVVVAAVVVIALVSGGNGHKSGSTTASQPSSTPTPSTASTPSTSSTPSSTTTTAANGAKLVAQINLTAPHSTSKAIGVALVLKQGTNAGIAIRAQNLPANGKHDAYAVWLYKSSTESQILGFVNPSVGANGVLQAQSALPANASHFTQLLVTRETQQKPHTPGAIVLRGALKGLS